MLRDGTLGGVFGGLSYTGSVQYPFGKPPQTRGEYNTQKAWIEKVKKFCDEHILGKVDKQKVSNPVDLPEGKLLQYADDAATTAKNDSGFTFRNSELLDSHYTKHGQEFGNITKDQYLNQANNLFGTSGKNILTKTRANGDVVFYNTTTNEFGVKSSDGFIRTYFKPTDGIDYFNQQ